MVICPNLISLIDFSLINNEQSYQYVKSSVKLGPSLWWRMCNLYYSSVVDVDVSSSMLVAAGRDDKSFSAETSNYFESPLLTVFCCVFKKSAPEIMVMGLGGDAQPL